MTRAITDLVRAACVAMILSLAAALMVEVRLRMAAIDIAHRAAIAERPPQVIGWSPAPVFSAGQPAAAEPPGRLKKLGDASLALGEAVLGIVR